MTDTSNLPGLILAGGLSRRMGENKALSMLGGKPLLHHVIARLAPQVSTLALNAPAGWADAFGLPLVPDGKPGHVGPLAGILAGMRHFGTHAPGATHVLTVPADSPFFPDDLLHRLAGHVPDADTIVTAASKGQRHPVFSLWPISIADDLENWLENEKNRRIRSFQERHPTLVIHFPPVESGAASIDPFFNINTPDELSQAEAFLKDITV